jgi:hypothetical protein
MNPIMFYAVAGALVVGAVAGYKVRDWQCDAAYAKALEKAGKQRAKADIILDTKSAAYEEGRATADARSTERTNTVREIYRMVPAAASSCAPPDDAIRVLIESIGNPNTEAAAGQSGEPVFPIEQPARSASRPGALVVGKGRDRAEE